MNRALAVRAKAHANIALIKYWGKRDVTLNLPAEGSLSLTLEALTTTTTIALAPDLKSDVFILNGQGTQGSAPKRVSEFVDHFRRLADTEARVHIESYNDFPTASGLASSASAFAALSEACNGVFKLSLSRQKLSELARRGSGSAARSIFGGIVRMHRGAEDDGVDSYAEPLAFDASNMAMVVAIAEGGQKKSHASRDAMNHCAETSPLYQAWLEQVPRDLDAAERALRSGDFTKLGHLVEANALAMHATAMASRPSIVYFRPTTLALLEEVRAIRSGGTLAFATMDAGPHVKVLCRPDDANAIAERLRRLPMVTQTLVSLAGGPSRVIEAHDE